MVSIEQRLTRIEAHLFGKAEQPQEKERTFEAFYVDCTQEQYPEVKRILEAQGYELLGNEWLDEEDYVTTTKSGLYMTYNSTGKPSFKREPIYTLPQLREKFGVSEQVSELLKTKEWRLPTTQEVEALEQPPKSKTRLEWLNELPDGYRERALANCSEWSGNSPQDVCDSMEDAIVGMCFLKLTLEGHDFWSGVFLHYTKGQPLPPLPSGNSEKPNTQEPPAQPVYEAGFVFCPKGICALRLPDDTKLWYSEDDSAWRKDRPFYKPKPHSLTPVATYTVGRFYALAGIEPNHLSDWRSYALCVKNEDVPYFVRPTSEYGIVSVDRIRPSHVSLNEVTPL